MLEADEGSNGEGKPSEAEVFGARREPTVIQAQAVSKGKQHTAPKRLRDSHHRVARLVAMGLRPGQVATKTGYSNTRIGMLMQSPAFQELVSKYRAEVDESFREAVDEFHSLATTNMLMAERQLNDKLHDADEIDEPLPTKDLVAITADRADRFGYGKNSTQLNLNVDFASQLERAIQRSGKVIEAVPEGLVSTSTSRQPAQPGPTVYEPVAQRGKETIGPAVADWSADVGQQAKPGPRRAPELATQFLSKGQPEVEPQPPTPAHERLRAVPAEAKPEVKRSPPIGIRRRI